MEIQIKNLGILKQAKFTLGDLTILCGGNNTGKTYATYALFGFLSTWQQMLSRPVKGIFSVHIKNEVIDQLLAEGVVRINLAEYIEQADQILAHGCQAYTEQLPEVFAAPIDRFNESEFQITLDSGDIRPVDQYEHHLGSANANYFSITKSKGSLELVVTLLMEKERTEFPKYVVVISIDEAIKDIIFSSLFPYPFIASTERTGAAIFRKGLAKDYQDYALPVKENLEFTQQLETVVKKNSFITENYPEVLAEFADIIGGTYTINSLDLLYYVPKGKRVKLSMDESSSAVRSLLHIGFYLRHVAQPGDLLMVDEPELNLHPENQRRVARLFARLVNLGIKVFITTHSDYIIKELNTLIMLNHNKPHLKRIAEKEGYLATELLSADKVKVYIAEERLVLLDGHKKKSKCHTLTPADIDPELGIEARSFDTTIETMNRIQEEIVWGVE